MAVRPLSERTVREAAKHLSEADKVMAGLVAKHPPCAIAGYEYRPFHILAGSIISQQLSSKAADTIERRIAAFVPSPFQPEGFLAVSVDALRAAGLSQAKARYIRELASRVVDGRLDLDGMNKLDNEAAIAALCETPGVGRWTAEMFLIFGLKRPDILAVGDAGLQRAARLLYGGKKKTDGLLERVGKAWAPYRSVASWYLWRHLDAAG